MLSAFSSLKTQDKSKYLLRQWVLTEMQVDNKKVSQQEFERQEKSGMKTVLHFQKGGVCMVYIKTAKGRITRRNTWKFSEDETKLTIKSESDPAMTFNIEKLTTKKMILVSEENNNKVKLTYNVFKK
jgi:hypothetical protein